MAARTCLCGWRPILPASSRIGEAIVDEAAERAGERFAKYITSYLNSQSNSYNHKNVAIEPRIPGIFQYYSVAEDELAKIYAGQVKVQAGADNIAAAWEKITDQIGRDNQIKLYRASIGL